MDALTTAKAFLEKVESGKTTQFVIVEINEESGRQVYVGGQPSNFDCSDLLRKAYKAFWDGFREEEKIRKEETRKEACIASVARFESRMRGEPQRCSQCGDELSYGQGGEPCCHACWKLGI